MLEWYQQFMKASSPEEALQIVGKHNINEQDDNGMTLLMHLVMRKKYNDYTRALLQSSDATQTALRKDLDLNIMNKNGEDVFLLATAAKNTEIKELIDIESTRKKRIQDMYQKHKEDVHIPLIGYHDTSPEAFYFIQKDRENNKYPMIGGSGGYFGGGIYFAVTKEESTEKALTHGRGFECRLKMGNIYKISSLTEKNRFYQTYFGTTDDSTRSWYKTPSDVIRMRLLTYGGNAYDSVWGHYNEKLSNTDDRILPTGDEYVVYSADQVHIQETFTIFYNHWLSNTIKTPPIHDFYRATAHRWGDVYITHRKKYKYDTIAFAYEEGSKRRFTETATYDEAFELPLEISKHIENCVEYYKPLFHILDRMDVPSNDAYFKTLFPTIPSGVLEDVLKKYTITMEPVEHSITFSRMDRGNELLYDLNKDFLFKDRPELIFEQLSQETAKVSLTYSVTIDEEDVDATLPKSLIESLQRLFTSEKATYVTFENQMDITVKEENESIFVSKLQSIIETYLRHNKHKPFSPKTSPLPPQAVLQRPYATYVVSEHSPPIPNETLQHGDIIGWKQDENRVWFYIRPTMDKEGTFTETYISQPGSILYIPIEVTRHLMDAETHYKDILTKLKWVKAKTIRIVISPGDTFWKNEKIFKPKVMKAIETIVHKIRDHHYTFIDYSTDYTLTKKSRSRGYIWIQSDIRKSLFTQIHYSSFHNTSKNLIQGFTELYMNSEPLVLTIKLSIHSANGKTIPLSPVFDRETIQYLQPIKWNIEGTSGQPSKLMLYLPRYTFEKTKAMIRSAIVNGGKWLPFSGRLKI
jgi:hypothetical protein